jgi:hypothetical protein
MATLKRISDEAALDANPCLKSAEFAMDVEDGGVVTRGLRSCLDMARV